MKPNALIIIATDVIGGPGKGLFQLLRYSNSFNFEYHLCNYHPAHAKGASNEFFEYAQQNGILINPLHQNWVIDPFLILRAYKIAKRFGCNLVQTHGYKSSVIGFFLQRIWGVPWIGFSHGYTFDNKKMALYNKIESFVLRYPDRVVAVSQSMKDLLIKKKVPEDKIVVIENAIESKPHPPEMSANQLKSKLGLSTSDFVIGVIGRLNPEKGHEVFLEALRNVVKIHPDVRVLILGKGQEEKKLKNYCDTCGLNNNVMFLGYRPDVWNYYQLMDLMVIPSHSEGLPNVLLEAMANGVPVVSTAVGGIPGIIGRNNGVLIPPGNPAVMAERILDLMENPEKRKTLSENGKKKVLSDFRPEDRAKKIVDLYNALLAGSSN